MVTKKAKGNGKEKAGAKKGGKPKAVGNAVPADAQVATEPGDQTADPPPPAPPPAGQPLAAPCSSEPNPVGDVRVPDIPDRVDTGDPDPAPQPEAVSKKWFYACMGVKVLVVGGRVEIERDLSVQRDTCHPHRDQGVRAAAAAAGETFVELSDLQQESKERQEQRSKIMYMLMESAAHFLQKWKTLSAELASVIQSVDSAANTAEERAALRVKRSDIEGQLEVLERKLDERQKHETMMREELKRERADAEQLRRKLRSKKQALADAYAAAQNRVGGMKRVQTIRLHRHAKFSRKERSTSEDFGAAATSAAEAVDTTAAREGLGVMRHSVFVADGPPPAMLSGDPLDSAILVEETGREDSRAETRTTRTSTRRSVESRGTQDGKGSSDTTVKGTVAITQLTDVDFDEDGMPFVPPGGPSSLIARHIGKGWESDDSEGDSVGDMDGMFLCMRGRWPAAPREALPPKETDPTRRRLLGQTPCFRRPRMGAGLRPFWRYLISSPGVPTTNVTVRPSRGRALFRRAETPADEDSDGEEIPRAAPPHTPPVVPPFPSVRRQGCALPSPTLRAGIPVSGPPDQPPSPRVAPPFVWWDTPFRPENIPRPPAAALRAASSGYKLTGISFGPAAAPRPPESAAEWGRWTGVSFPSAAQSAVLKPELLAAAHIARCQPTPQVQLSARTDCYRGGDRHVPWRPMTARVPITSFTARK